MLSSKQINIIIRNLELNEKILSHGFKWDKDNQRITRTSLVRTRLADFSHIFHSIYIFAQLLIMAKYPIIMGGNIDSIIFVSIQITTLMLGGDSKSTFAPIQLLNYIIHNSKISNTGKNCCVKYIFKSIFINIK